MDVGVIDLGDVTGSTAPRPMPVPGPVLRRAGLLAMAVLVLLGLTASVRRPPAFDQPLWTVDTGSFTWGADTLYLIDPDGRAVSAHDPATGTVRWRLALDRPVVGVTEVGAGLAAVQLGSGPAAPRPDLTVVLVDRAGRPLARIPGEIPEAGPARPSLLVRDSSACGDDACATLSRIDLTTGTAAWSLPLGPRRFLPAQACQGDTFAVLDGPAAEVRSAATLDVTARVAWPANDGGLLQAAALYDDDLVTAELVAGGIVVTAHPLRPGAASWSLTLPQGATPTGISAGLFTTTCAGVLCAQVDNGTALIDRYTGKLLAVVPASLFVVPGVAAAAPDSVGPGGILLALAGPSAGGQRNTLIIFDASAGAPLAYFPDRAIVPWSRAGGRAMLLREGGGRSGFTALDGKGEPTQLGSVAGTDLTCTAQADLLACSTENGQLRLFRLPTLR